MDDFTFTLLLELNRHIGVRRCRWDRYWSSPGSQVTSWESLWVFEWENNLFLLYSCVGNTVAEYRTLSRPWDPWTRSDSGQWSDLGIHCSGGPDLWPETLHGFRYFQHSGAVGHPFSISLCSDCRLSADYPLTTTLISSSNVFLYICVAESQQLQFVL